MTKEVKYSIIRLILGIALYVGEIITVRRIELDMVFVIVWLLIVHFLFSYGANICTCRIWPTKLLHL